MYVSMYYTVAILFDAWCVSLYDVRSGITFSTSFFTLLLFVAVSVCSRSCQSDLPKMRRLWRPCRKMRRVLLLRTRSRVTKSFLCATFVAGRCRSKGPTIRSRADRWPRANRTILWIELPCIVMFPYSLKPNRCTVSTEASATIDAAAKSKFKFPHCPREKRLEAEKCQKIHDQSVWNNKPPTKSNWLIVWICGAWETMPFVQMSENVCGKVSKRAKKSATLQSGRKNGRSVVASKASVRGSKMGIKRMITQTCRLVSLFEFGEVFDVTLARPERRSYLRGTRCLRVAVGLLGHTEALAISQCSKLLRLGGTAEFLSPLGR